LAYSIILRYLTGTDEGGRLHKPRNQAGNFWEREKGVKRTAKKIQKKRRERKVMGNKNGNLRQPPLRGKWGDRTEKKSKKRERNRKRPLN